MTRLQYGTLEVATAFIAVPMHQPQQRMRLLFELEMDMDRVVVGSFQLRFAFTGIEAQAVQPGRRYVRRQIAGRRGSTTATKQRQQQDRAAQESMLSAEA